MAGKRTRQAFEADLPRHEPQFVFYGTPLPPLDERVRDDGSYIPIWKQEVTDDRGRKRLHGAFTGGFSAGYYNTVGSKEGWTPATFVSSRQNRMKDTKNAVRQRAEDFMDEEDLREAEEARTLTTSEQFAGFGSKESDSYRQGGLMDVFKITGETMGVKLLKKMGWREGQGIGPRVRRKANLGDSGTELEEKHLFAPENPPMVSFRRKTDYKGIEYPSESGFQKERPQLSEIGGGERGIENSADKESTGSVLQFRRIGKDKPAQVKSSGFGLGVLNDNGSDDEDPYQMGPQISYNRVVGGDRKPKKKKDPSLRHSNPLLKEKPVFLSKKNAPLKSSSGFRKCYDGRLPLDGFILSDDLDSFASMSLIDDKFKPPEVPPEWKSVRALGTNLKELSYKSTAEAAKASSLDIQSRAALLGEIQLPGKSVFDFITPAAREKLAAATGKTNLPEARGEKPPASFELNDEQKKKSLQDLVPELDADVALQALNRGVGGWMPYAEDESKRSRYRAYLEIRSGLRPRGELPPKAAPNTSTEDWVLEMHEFARAAQVFKPVTGLMASRFTLSSTEQSSAFTGTEATSGESLLTNPAANKEDPAVEAAKMGMFGPLTRSVQRFYPSRLLCKRFNVKPPEHVDTRLDVEPLSGDGGARGHTKVELGGFQPVATEPASHQTSALARALEAPRGPTTVDPERNQAIEQERPGEAVFKAIFGSDDEDDE